MSSISNNDSLNSSPSSSSSRSCKDILIMSFIIIIINVIVISTAALLFWYLNKNGYIELFIQWLDKQQRYSIIIIIILYIIPSLPGIPGIGVMLLICGFLFGFIRGVIIATIGLQLGTFVICCSTRYLFFKKANIFIEKRGGKTLIIIKEMLLSEPFKFALILRFLPQPTGLTNVFLGIIDISFWIIQITTFIGCFIRTCSAVYLGSTARTISDMLYGKKEWSWATILPIIIGIIGVILATIFTITISKKAISQLKLNEQVEEIELEEVDIEEEQEDIKKEEDNENF